MTSPPSIYGSFAPSGPISAPKRSSRSPRRPLLRNALLLLSLSSTLVGCNTRHWAEVAETPMPPPAGERVLHTDRLVIHVRDESKGTQCVAYEKYRPVCFHNIRDAIENGLVRGLWPSFPEVVVGSNKDASPSDYLLQVDVTMDALPPDDAGPGWSAGIRTRFRLMREGRVITEETLASRSRAQFPYGAPLGEGATEVMDATVSHMAGAISRVPESRPDTPIPLPVVASRAITQEAKIEVTEAKPAVLVPETGDRQAKKSDSDETMTDVPAPPPQPQ